MAQVQARGPTRFNLKLDASLYCPSTRKQAARTVNRDTQRPPETKARALFLVLAPEISQGRNVETRNTREKEKESTWDPIRDPTLGPRQGSQTCITPLCQHLPVKCAREVFAAAYWGAAVEGLGKRDPRARAIKEAPAYFILAARRRSGHSFVRGEGISVAGQPRRIADFVAVPPSTIVQHGAAGDDGIVCRACCAVRVFHVGAACRWRPRVGRA